MNNLKEVKKLVGNTPLIAIKYRFNNRVQTSYFKLEWYNLTGSIKDRVALGIIQDAYKTNKLKPGQAIVETTSGNMGISLCAVGKSLGHKVVIFMPKSMSEERKKLLKLYGGELHLSNNFDMAFKEAGEYAKTNDAFLANQFDNQANMLSHYNSTAKEIAKKIKNPKKFLAGVGTAGTLMGVGSYLKQQYNTKIIALEPASSKILSNGKTLGKHKLQGLSDDIVPGLYKSEKVDKIISVTDEDAIAMAQKISKELGLGIGISSGANMVGCVLVGGAISVFTDDNKKYLSTDLSTPCSTSLVDSIELLGYKVL